MVTRRWETASEIVRGATFVASVGDTDDKAVATLHQYFGEIGQLRFMALGLLVQPTFRSVVD